jgi:outer membrane protein OmpA-like peptidoglycan-associated protein
LGGSVIFKRTPLIIKEGGTESMMSLKKTAIYLVSLFLFCGVPGSYAFDASEDVAGSRDSDYFKRYARSKIEDYSQSNTADYLFSLSAPKTVNGVMELEYAERLSGELTRITYRAPDAEPSNQVFDHYSSQLKQLSHNLLYECHARECGDSNLWANSIFGIRKLYGPQRYQHYLAAQLTTDEGPLFVALYVVQRGNKRVYIQLDLLKPEDGRLGDLAVNPDTILEQLKINGVFNLRNLKFDASDGLAQESDKRLAAVVEALKKNTRLKLYIVGNLSGADDLDVLKSRSLVRAEAVRGVLVDAGIELERLIPQGIGPLAPVQQGSDNADRIGLVLQE